MTIFNRKQDMPSEDGNGVLRRGRLTIPVINRKQDMPSEDVNGVLRMCPLKIAIFNSKHDMPSEDGMGFSVWVLLRWLSSTGSKICHQKMEWDSPYGYC